MRTRTTEINSYTAAFKDFSFHNTTHCVYVHFHFIWQGTFCFVVDCLLVRLNFSSGGGDAESVKRKIKSLCYVMYCISKTKFRVLNKLQNVGLVDSIFKTITHKKTV